MNTIDEGELVLRMLKADSVIELNRLLDAVLRVEHNYMTLRTPEGWLLWSQKVTSESALGPALKMATANLDYKQGT